jgi:sulfur relay (sulfurtransferase) DsrC/TusE family protein
MKSSEVTLSEEVAKKLHYEFSHFKNKQIPPKVHIIVKLIAQSAHMNKQESTN